MLQIKNISKQYRTGELIQDALKGVSLNLRDNEFVSILGPSGSGKTTLLNIIGGLDRYDSGDLIINGISTKEYRDRDWDAYRNHTIGFVFQSYNLIPHQSVLANVELALTIGGVSHGERRKRAKQALEMVGLGNQLHKKPNQMSGGQMQRVAIARALVNNPDILLADEPTGALDTETSVQIMELLKEVAKDRLVVMVTHNPELAQQYSTRIVKLRDGNIVDDSDPYIPRRSNRREAQHKRIGKTKMSFWTSLSLSFNNLSTKKGRTLLTAFAGSIGIIGIALILSLSTGVNNYIADIQKETMTSYPITISAETIDMSGIMGLQGQMMGARNGGQGSKDERDGIYANSLELEVEQTLTSSVTENDLTAFKKYLDDADSEIQQYLGENGVVYGYDVNFDVYSYDADGNIVNTNADTESISESSSNGFNSVMENRSQMISSMTAMMGVGGGSAENFSELMVGANGKAVSDVITDSYDLVYGSWPENYDEAVLVLDSNNGISTSVLYQLGFITADEYKDIVETIEDGGEAPEISFDYETACGHKFYLVAASDYYQENENGTFSYVGEDTEQLQKLLDQAVELNITGVIRPISDTANATIMTSVAYTSKLTDYVIQHANESQVVLAQEETPDINVLSGMEFEEADDAGKVEDAIAYISQLGVSDKASLYTMILYYSAENAANQMADANGEMPADGDVYADEEVYTDGEMYGDADVQMYAEAQQKAQMQAMMQIDETSKAEALDQWIAETPDEEILLSIYDQYIDGASYEDNMEAFGKVSYDAPSTISIYTDSFEDKEAVSDCITAYNDTVDSDTQITYTDYVELMTSSLTTIIDVISYVLIAFVAVSLVVSCIMIGIITHISVLERTKEIGILRALGASKRNISQVFNAETIIIGFCAGLLGVGVSALLTIPINKIIWNLLGSEDMRASLPFVSAGILVVISVIITVIGGLFPAKKASKKDPVIALRTE